MGQRRGRRRGIFLLRRRVKGERKSAGVGGCCGWLDVAEEIFFLGEAKLEDPLENVRRRGHWKREDHDVEGERGGAVGLID